MKNPEKRNHQAVAAHFRKAGAHKDKRPAKELRQFFKEHDAILNGFRIDPRLFGLGEHSV